MDILSFLCLSIIIWVFGIIFISYLVESQHIYRNLLIGSILYLIFVFTYIHFDPDILTREPWGYEHSEGVYFSRPELKIADELEKIRKQQEKLIELLEKKNNK